MLWHRDQYFDFKLNTRKKTLRIPIVLPRVPARSSMYREFKEFIASRQSDGVPGHRRVDPRNVSIRISNRAGNIGLTFTVRNHDYGYATRKLINLVQEIYLGFLYDGPYYDYMVETFNLDPDHM